MALVVSIRIRSEQDESDELALTVRAVNASLDSLALQHPRAVAIGWCMDGNTDSLVALMGADGKAVCVEGWQEQCKALAHAISQLPPSLLAHFEHEFERIRGPQSPHDAP